MNIPPKKANKLSRNDDYVRPRAGFTCIILRTERMTICWLTMNYSPYFAQLSVFARLHFQAWTHWEIFNSHEVKKNVLNCTAQEIKMFKVNKYS